ncbi:MAG: ATP-binding cassette domain-containing protein [Brachybacterium tyrofermentans]|uniref:ATP-binding cassette domain-containing protein n=1 Tax=Brachybacterium TaxID=43668 RepID=UPI000BB7589C|nr:MULTISPECIES: ABC transporter ATP-binding protein [Brachybacterium]MDN6302332.1 ABC transporter ATP-binding protein [Brachybacterium sp.]MDN6329424.1 ABC transporter ATP-binding protein [Brachybacterium sp.]MDN6399552.1 ABC transporter ATP-binding protein [Brachybacterium sp.]PCC34024.1 peptide ABC transporter ATP-binding protein [Brachybacterium alimentarium]RCS63885.1 ABC transporter ATP-binding protein [Brachybacterium alimentarium]
MSTVLEATDLAVEYRGHRTVRAVDGVSLTISAGEVLALVGESGCGKSSTARAVIGMEKPHSGDIRFRGAPVPPLGLRRRKAELTAMQMVFQDPNSSLNPRKRVGDQIADGVTAARSRGLSSDAPRQWLGAVGLDPDMVTRYPHQFSGGQRQRIAIARALAAQPDLLVADEPISALDASSQSEVASMMRRLVLQAGAGMLFISHDLSVVRIMADRVAVMYRGRIVESGPTAMVWADPVHPYTKALLGAIPHPDGKGVLPAAPAAEAPAEWHEELPGALDRG